MTKLIKTAALAAALLPAAAQAQNVPAAVIAVVDVERVLTDCTACRAANPQLQALGAQIQQRQQALAGPLQTEGQAIQAEVNRVQALPAGAAKTTAENALRSRINAFQQRQEAANGELQRLQQNAQSTQANVLRQISDRLNTIYPTVMQQRGANLMLAQNQTLAAGRTIDITDTVLATLNQQLPSVSVTPLPAQPNTAQPARPQGR